MYGMKTDQKLQLVYKKWTRINYNDTSLRIIYFINMSL